MKFSCSNYQIGENIMVPDTRRVKHMMFYRTQTTLMIDEIVGFYYLIPNVDKLEYVTTLEQEEELDFEEEVIMRINEREDEYFRQISKPGVLVRPVGHEDIILSFPVNRLLMMMTPMLMVLLKEAVAKLEE